MEPFYGTWKVQLEKSQGIKEFGQAFGWPDDKIEMLSKLDYTMLLEQSGDSVRCFLDYKTFNLEFIFKLGEEFDYVGADGTKAKLTVSLEGGKIVEKYSNDKAAWTTVREVDGNNMKVVTTVPGFDNIKGIQELVKV